MFFEALYFGHFLSFHTMQLEPPKTKASHCANNGNACCIARSLICRQLLLPATFTPSTSRQFNDAPFVQSRSLPFCAAITNFARILAIPRPLPGLCGVAN